MLLSQLLEASICLRRVDVKGLGEKRIPVCYTAEEFSDVDETKVIHRVCPFQFTLSISKEQLGGAKRGWIGKRLVPITRAEG
jgi:hypothetical protein